MAISQLRTALVLSAWSLIVWTTRIGNIWADDTLSLAGQLGRTALALSFTAFAVVTVAAWVHGRRNEGSTLPCAALWVRAFAVWTVGVWLVRGVQIALADHGAAFVAVHTALAMISIVLAVLADRGAQRPAPSRVPQATTVG